MKLPGTLAIVLAISAAGNAHAATQAAAPDRAAERILAAAKQASGGAAWDKIDTIVVDVTLKTAHGEAAAGSKTDLRNGRDLLHFTMGPMSGAMGWDGKQAWTIDPNTGAGVVERSPQEIAQRRTAAYSNAYGFYFPSRWPVSARHMGRVKQGNASFDVVAIKPEGGAPMELWFNAETHLIERQVSPQGQPPQTQYFSDHRQVGGVTIPFSTRSVITANGQEMHTSQVTSVKVNAPLGDADFAAPAAKQQTR